MAKQQPDIRDVIKAEMERRGLTTYALWKLVEKHVTKPTVYDYLSGQGEITTAKLQHILNALDLRLTR